MYKVYRSNHTPAVKEARRHCRNPLRIPEEPATKEETQQQKLESKVVSLWKMVCRWKSLQKDAPPHFKSSTYHVTAFPLVTKSCLFGAQTRPNWHPLFSQDKIQRVLYSVFVTYRLLAGDSQLISFHLCIQSQPVGPQRATTTTYGGNTKSTFS